MGGAWVATEKLHGANFVVGICGDAPYFGTRKQWLAPDAAFFGWQLIAIELADRCRSVARELGATQVVCYGELFGGAYPHPDVTALPGMAPVQTGIWYAPDVRWAMFDTLVATGDDDYGELLAFSDVERLAARAGLVSVPVLGRGKRTDLDRMPVEGPTELPALFGLPALANNLREGFVLKPDRRLPLNARPIIKRKLADFDDVRFGEGPGWQPGYLSADQLVAWAVRLVNPPRVASARSKVGNDPIAVVDEIVLEVAVDLETVFAAAWRDLDAAGEARVLAEVKCAATLAVSGS